MRNRGRNQKQRDPVNANTEVTVSHRPVMLEECLEALALKPGGIYMDGTFGRGGHSRAILERIAPGGALHAFDQDPAAVAVAREAFADATGFSIHHCNFSELGRVATECGFAGRVDGILLDLGVSSPQLDEAERGFSFGKDGPLDMRMNPQAGQPASAWLSKAPEAEIADVIYQYGEERASRRIARRIVEARSEAPIERTTQLAEIIQKAVPGPRQKIHPATRSFQAIRIFINRELDVLPAALEAAVDVLAPGGRLAVISFHSLEDRIVKQFIRDAATPAPEPWPPIPDAVPSPPPKLRSVGRVFPGEHEAQRNPRARSAVLRVAERRA